MKIILSPAKSINFDKIIDAKKTSMPIFLTESEYLINKLKKLSKKKISTMMKVSADIGELNYNRFQNWTLPFTTDNSKPAGDIFAGTVYQGLDYSSLTENEQEVGQAYLRILSGLYGLLKPADLIQPYRLEMGVRFVVTPKMKNLYHYWGTKISKTLNEELMNEEEAILVNLASSEYFRAANLNTINCPVITPVFKDKSKTGEYKVTMTYAKKARGLMTRFIIQNELKKAEELKAFDTEGYMFSVRDSSENEFVFIRG